MHKLMFSALALALVAGCSNADSSDTTESKPKETTKQELKASVDAVVETSDGISLWEELLTSGHRSDKNKQRDQYRHPKETLEFFGIKPGMTVVEIAPGEVEYYRNGRAKFERKMDVESDVYGNVTITTFQPPEIFDIAPDGSADAVVTFRNVHNWLRGGREATVDSFKAMYKALKPGGVLGVVEHRLPKSQEQDEKASSGYMHQDFVISVAQDAGFKLVASSEINANPKDTADHPKGVWTLPPSLRLGDQDKDKYMEIGESDRMTLKFVKPAKK